MRQGEGRSQREILAGRAEGDAGFVEAVEWAFAFRRFVSKIATRKHIGRVLPGNLHECRITYEWWEPYLGTFLIHEIQHLSFELRCGWRICNGEGQFDAL